MISRINADSIYICSPLAKHQAIAFAIVDHPELKDELIAIASKFLAIVVQCASAILFRSCYLQALMFADSSALLASNS